MTQPTSRKQFFGKLLGMAAVATVAPKLLAKSTVTSVTPVSLPFALRPDSRAVARKSGEL